MEGLNDQELFAQAVADQPAETPAAPEPAQAEQVQEQPSINRDEQGRFAARAAEEQAAQQPTPTPAATPEPTIPPGVLREEKEKRRALEREIAELRGQMSVITRQQPQQPAPQPKALIDIFENPDEAIRERVAPQFQEINQTLLSFARENAELRFTPERVSEAEQAFMQAMQTRSLDPADYNRVVNAPNRYTAAVQWHQRQNVLKEVGPDPEVYKARVLEEALKDQAFLAKALEAARASAGQQQPGKPSSVVQLPPSLNRASSAASPHEVAGDLSNESLYAFATR